LYHALLGTSCIMPYYHMVSDEAVPHVRHLYAYRNLRQFRESLDFFLAHYEPLALGDLLDHLDGRRPWPARCFFLSFDDGFREMHDLVAPILRAKGVPATFFLTSGFVDNRDMAHHCKVSLLLEHLSTPGVAECRPGVAELLAEHRVEGESLEKQMLSIRYSQRNLVAEIAAFCNYDFGRYLATCKPYLTSAQIRRLLRQDFSIGAHSVDHPLYARLSLAEQVRQTRESLRFLRDRFQVDSRAFAFPHSDAGVTRQFFEEIFRDGQLAVSFGTGGMVRHFFRRNFERFTLEKTTLSAREVTAKQYARGLCRKLAHRNPAAPA
jgi:peptidoglycan/xylan/chitin deacetylase (PgdA/CDA1 family)